MRLWQVLEVIVFMLEDQLWCVEGRGEINYNIEIKWMKRSYVVERQSEF